MVPPREHDEGGVRRSDLLVAVAVDDIPSLREISRTKGRQLLGDRSLLGRFCQSRSWWRSAHALIALAISSGRSSGAW